MRKSHRTLTATRRLETVNAKQLASSLFIKCIVLLCSVKDTKNTKGYHVFAQTLAVNHMTYQ